MNRTKSKMINFRVTEPDYNRICQKAEKTGLSITAFLTTMALEGQVIVVVGIHEAALALNRIGNNLNQLTRLCHQGAITCPELSGMKNEVKNIWQSLNSLTRKAV